MLYYTHFQGTRKPSNTEFLIKLVMEAEDSLVTCAPLNGHKMKTIVPQKLNIYHLDIGLEKLMKSCHDVSRITPCIKKFYEEKYGHSYINRSIALLDEHVTKYAGKEELFKKTGT